MSKQNDFFGASPNTVLNKPFMHLQDQKPSGTSGGTSIAGTQTRTLNTVLTNEISGASLAGNAVILPAGTYFIDAVSTVGWDMGGGVKLRLYNVTSSSYISEGISSWRFGEHGLRTKISLSTTTTIEMRQYTSTAYANGLGVPSSQGIEVYTDLKIWQLDAVTQTPVIGNTSIYPIPGGAVVEGNMFGLEYARTGNNQVTIQPGICMDSRNTTLCTLASQQTLSLPAVINGIYNLFICNDGVVRYDTDVNGSSLAAYKIRWIGFVRNNASGVLVIFQMTKDLLMFGKSTENQLASLNGQSTYVTKDHSILIPTSRVSEIMYGMADNGSTQGHAVTSIDGVNIEYHIGLGYSAPTTDISTWSHSSYKSETMMPFTPNRYFKTDGNNGLLLIHAVKLRR
jgi:hypothetical protein